MSTRRAMGLLVCGVLLAACSAPSGSDRAVVEYDFAHGPQGWIADFSDYPVGSDEQFELVHGAGPLPPPLDTSRSALFISGNNHSDDLFMYYRTRADGLRPDTVYRVTFAVEFATSVPHGCSGVGGQPGESVWIKAGVSTREPVPIVKNGDHRLDVDKGEQSNDGVNALVLGNVANSHPCARSVPWELKRLGDTRSSLRVRTDAQGSLWLFFGAESGFEATTSLFHTGFAATLVPESAATPAARCTL